jgi:hypothetical protein
MFSASKTKQVVASGPYTLTKSLRFRSSANGYLNRTPASTTNRQTWTFSAWVKRANLTSSGTIFEAAVDANNRTTFYLEGPDGYFTLQQYTAGATDFNFNTTPIYKDTSAWYHFVIVADTTNATQANRLKFYVNNVLQSVSGTLLNQNLNTYVNSNNVHNIGRYIGGALYLDSYLTDIYLIDGQALTPSSFGATDATTGVWTPARYTGSYGTNGFHLTFTNTTSTTTLCYDSSGNGNNFTPTNISLTAGSTYDSMNDVPMLTSATASNYCVLNPVSNTGTYPSTLSNGNLNFVGPSGGSGASPLGTFAVSSGKWYWEVTLTSAWSGGCALGIVSTQYNPSWNADSYFWNFSYGYGYEATTGKLYTNHVATTYGATYTSGDVIGVALDLNAGTLTFYKNNVSQGTAASGLSGTFYPTVYTFSCGSGYINFGQQPFVYTPPSGYVSLNTYNLPTPTILQGNKYMDATTYTGTGAIQSITNAGAFKPDLVWIKRRSSAADHALYDSVRGALKLLQSDTTSAEFTDTAGTGLTGFNSNGFALGTDTTSSSSTNSNSSTYVGWQWQAGQGSSSSNTNGSITSTVSVSTTAGFSIVTYTGTGAAATVGHGLGVAPSLIICKSRTVAGSNWVVYTQTYGKDAYLLLNSSSSYGSFTNYWGSSNPTSTVFGVVAGPYDNNNGNMVAYCFAPVAGFSSFGSYTGNGSSTGPFVYCGFEPSFVLIKNGTNSGPQWWILDNKRNPYNTANLALPTSLSLSEQTIPNTLNFLSNGFQIQTTNGDFNTSGSTMVYMAFAQNPFKYSNAF